MLANRYSLRRVGQARFAGRIEPRIVRAALVNMHWEKRRQLLC
jgi:hypothetical protein